MPRLLIVYGTTDGQTAKIVDVISGTLRDRGCDVDVDDARLMGSKVQPEGYDGVLVAASVHARGYQRAVRRWVRGHARQRNQVPSAFASVCLGILEANEEAQREVRAIPERLFSATGWQPKMTRIIAGALPYTRYGWLKKMVMRRIVAKAGGDTDTTRDFEYTDWDDVRAFAREFSRNFAATAGAAPLAPRSEPTSAHLVAS